MALRERKRPAPAKKETPPPPQQTTNRTARGKAVSAAAGATESEIDDVLDEFDATREAQDAESFVRGYVQKGGE